jgi:hypothetical protein
LTREFEEACTWRLVHARVHLILALSDQNAVSQGETLVDGLLFDLREATASLHMVSRVRDNLNVNEKPKGKKQPERDERQGPLVGWQLVVAIAIGAVVIIVALLTTDSADDVKAVAIAMAVVIFALLRARAFNGKNKWKG